MYKEDVAPYGSESVSKSEADNSQDQPEVIQQETVQEAPQKEEKQQDNGMSKLEKMLQDSQSMIGRQSAEIGNLRAKLESMGKKEEPQQPNHDSMIKEIMKKVESGDMSMEEGMMQALSLNSEKTASQVLERVAQKNSQEKIASAQQNFLKQNPDYQQVLQSGALQPYLDADPLADEYVAYTKFKADDAMNKLKQEFEGKLSAAKEEGAKLAKGSEAAGKVIGKVGVSPSIQAPPKPFKNSQEAANAMMETLKQFRANQT